MKIVICKDCGRDEFAPDFTPLPWVCDDCEDLHRKNSLQDMDIETELNQEEC